MHASVRSSFFSLSLLLIAILGCGGASVSSGGGSGTGGSGNKTGPLTPSNSVYVTSNSSVLQFSRTANGSVTPAATITGPLGFSPHGLAIDSAGNLYVGYDQAGSTKILEYAPGASGFATPIRIISGPDTDLQAAGADLPIFSMDVDSAGNLYVGVGDIAPGKPSPPGILVFSPTASGDAAPTKSFLTTLVAPHQLAVDYASNIYAASYANIQFLGFIGPGSVSIYNSTASGTASPDSYIDLPDSSSIAVGVAVDSAGNVYVASEHVASPQQLTSPSILVFSASSTGSATPVRTISGAATTMNQIGGLRVDSAGNIYVLNQTSTGAPSILKFSATASGNTAPIATITSSTFATAGGDIALQK